MISQVSAWGIIFYVMYQRKNLFIMGNCEIVLYIALRQESYTNGMS